MREPTTPEEFCWLYACGCLENRLQARTLTVEAFEEAQKHLADGTYPPPKKVRAWFPKPFRYLEGSGVRTTLREMLFYWRVTHHNETQMTPVYVAQVIQHVSIEKEGIEFIRLEILDSFKRNGSTIVAPNYHRYKLERNVLVYMHEFIIAEPFPR